MDPCIPIAEGIHWVGLNDRRTRLFESLWPIPDGIAYNCYLIDDEKTVLIDSVKDLFSGDLVGNLRAVLGPDRGLDYLVINHIEPDHSGSVRLLRHLYPQMRLVVNKKTAEFLRHLYSIEEDLVVVGDGDQLDLGRRTLHFALTPMVHWPETMMTYEPESGILFSGDAFGGYGVLDRGIFDDDVPNQEWYEDEALRYFSNIVGRVSPMVQKALQKAAHLDIRIVAPTHGLVWRRSPGRIVELFDRWSSYQAEPAAVLAYASMYGNTERAAETFASRLNAAGVKDLRIHDVSHSHQSYILRDIWRAKVLVLGTPTYEIGVFPRINELLHLLEEKKLADRSIGIFGSYGWSGGGVKGVREFAEQRNWEVLEPVVEVRFKATDDDRVRFEQLAQAVSVAVNE